MTRSRILAAAALLALTCLPPPSPAEAASCTVSAGSVAFGSFSPLTLANVDSNGSITVNCTDVASYTVALSTGSSGIYGSRYMVSGGNHLNYNLYSDAAYSQVWGDGNNGSSTVSLSNPVNGQNNVHAVYGRIPLSSQRDARVASYSDSILVTVSY